MLYKYSSTLMTYPMYVDSRNCKAALEIMKMSIELGGFPLIDLVFEPAESDQVQKQFGELQSL